MFKVGDRVISYSKTSPYAGTIVEIESTMAYVKRDDGKGDSPSGSWSCRVDRFGRIATANGAWDGVTYLKKLETWAKPILNISIKNMAEKKQICEISFKRKEGDQYLFIKLDPKIVALFKTKSIRKSENYLDESGNGLKFYEPKPSHQQWVVDFQNQNRIGISNLDNYGTELVSEGQMNFSLLRTVGIEDGVSLRITSLITDVRFNNWVETLGSFIKFIYKNYIVDSEIRVTITMEV